MSHFDQEENLRNIRNVNFDVDPIFIKRWSPRAYTGEKIPLEILQSIVEAGRLAPSCANSQPWRVIYAERESKEWQSLFNLLVPANQEWVKNCAYLLLIVSKKKDAKLRELNTNSFDTGAFWASMALEAAKRGLPMHAMAGFNQKMAAETFQLENDYHIEVMVAIGVPGKVENLSEKNQARETPSKRLNLEEILIHVNRARDSLAR